MSGRTLRSELFGQLRHCLEQVGDQADIGNLEDRRVLVLVDRDDGLGILHPGKVLDRTRDTDRDIDLGSDDLARLADLVVIGDITRVDRRPACANTGAELVGERGNDLFEGFRILECAAARDDNLGTGQFGTIAFCDFFADEARETCVGWA